MYVDQREKFHQPIDRVFAKASWMRQLPHSG